MRIASKESVLIEFEYASHFDVNTGNPYWWPRIEVMLKDGELVVLELIPHPSRGTIVSVGLPKVTRSA